MGITNLGAVGISAGGVYNSETVYKKYKVVSANGGSYMYINPTPAAGVPVTETSHWQQIATMGGQDLVDAAVAARDAAQAQAALAQGYADQLAAGLLRPKGVYADLAALIAGIPTVADTNEIYITLADGKWCYHNGTTWVAGGQFQAASVVDDIESLNTQLEDFKNEFTLVKSLNLLRESELTSGYMTTSGVVVASEVYQHTEKITVSEGDIVTRWYYTNNPNEVNIDSMRFVTAFDSDGNINTAAGSDIARTSYTVPFGVSSVVISASFNTFPGKTMILLNAVGTPAVFYPYFSPYYTLTEQLLSGVVDRTLSLPGMAADAKTVGDLAQALQLKPINLCINDDNESGFINYYSGAVSAHGTYFHTGFIPIRKGQAYATHGMLLPHFSRYNELKFALINAGENDYSIVLNTMTVNGWRVFTASWDGFIRFTVYESSSIAKVIPIPDSGWAASHSVSGVYPEGEEQFIPKGKEDTDSEIAGIKSDLSTIQNTLNDIQTDSNPLNKGYAKVSGNLSSGQTLTLPRTNIKKNNVYSFFGKITTFGSILIGHGKTAYSSTYLIINSEKVIATRYFAEASTTEYAHALSFANYVWVLIEVGNNSKAKISIMTNELTHEISNVDWNGDSDADYFVECVDGSLSDCVFTWGSQDFRKTVWVFGDSYLSFTSAQRWPYYLAQSGHVDNVLFNSYPGQGSISAVAALNNMIPNYGKPRIAVWTLGMNDGSDTGGVPSLTWSSKLTEFLALCIINNIVPILCTIPSVPGINHESKNAYVRSSGHRYIDFAKAVGAQPDGTWYPNMLYSDSVHPGTLGAKALFMQAIQDCPELTFSNP